MMKNNIKDNIVLFSNDNNEPSWVKENRLNAYEKIQEYNHPNFGPEIKIDIDLNCYFENKFIPFEIQKDGFVACDIHTAFVKYEKILRKYYRNLISGEENRYTNLNSIIFESGYFIYVPKNKKIDFPIFNQNVNCDFTKNIIIVDDGAELNFVDVRNYSSKIACDNVEVFVEKGAKCKYLNVSIGEQNGAITSMKKAQVLKNAQMDWINIISGPSIYMGYPSTILKGDNSMSTSITLSIAEKNKSINVGAKMIHEGINTNSKIKNISLVKSSGEIEIRNLVNIKDTALNSNSTVMCEYGADKYNTKYDNVPKYIIDNDFSNIYFKTCNSNYNEVDIVKFIEDNFIKLSDKHKETLQNLINN